MNVLVSSPIGLGVWMVTVRPYSRVAFEMVQGEHPTLAVALVKVVAEDERRG